MRRGLFISALLHVAVIAAAYFGLPSLFRPEIVASAPSVVDIVKALPEKPKEKEPEPPKPEPKRPEPPRTEKAPEIPEPPSIPEPPPVKAAEAPPEPAPEPPPPEPKKKPEAKPKPIPKPVAAPPPKKVPAIRVASAAPPPKRRPQRNSFDSLLKNLAKPKPVAKAEPASPATKANASPDSAARQAATSIDRRRIETELVTSIKNQVARCWNIPAGAKDAREMKIGVRILLNRDGSIIGAPQVIDSARMTKEPFYRAVAESALRALQICKPLRLPIQQYDVWKSITFNFDPSEALGP